MVVTAYFVSNISSSSSGSSGGGGGGDCSSGRSGASLSCYSVGCSIASGIALSATTIAVLENIKPLRV